MILGVTSASLLYRNENEENKEDRAKRIRESEEHSDSASGHVVV